MDKKNSVINTIKGIAIILVVYGHTIQKGMSTQGQDFFLNPAFKFIYAFHMPLFVLISGYLLAFSLKRKSAGETVKSRYVSLFVPFIAWGVLDIVVNHILGIVDGKGLAIINVPYELASNLFLNPAVWFLFTLFILSAVLVYSVELSKRFGMMIVPCVYLLIACLPFNEYCALYYIKWFYMFYLTGYYINIYGEHLIQRFNHVSWFVIATILFVVLLSFWTKSDYIYVHKMTLLSDHYWEDAVRFVYRYGIGFIGIAMIFYVGVFCLNNRVGQLLSVIGTYSLDVYLIQRYVVEGVYPRVLEKMHWPIDFNAGIVLYGVVPFIAVLLVGLCILISKFGIRKNVFLSRILLGGRV